MRLLLALAVLAGAWAQTNASRSPEKTGLLEQIKQRATEDLATIPNYVCVDSVERSLWIPGKRQFRRLDRVHLELSHIEGADRFAWLGNSAFHSRTPTAMVGYGASFGGDFADNRTLVFKRDWVKITYAGRVTTDGRPALLYDYDAPRGVLGVANGEQSGYAPARGSFWIDPQTLDLLRIDIEGYAIPPRLAVQSISDSTTYWRVLIGKRTVLLPRNSEFRLTNADGTATRNVSVFSNCREYTADSTLTFGSGPAPRLAPAGDEDTHLEPGLQIELALDKTLDSNAAAVGESIRAHVLKGDGGIPRGAHVYGRVTRIINFDDQVPLPPAETPRTAPTQTRWGHPGQVLIQVEFSQLEYRRRRARFVARLIDLEPQRGKPEAKILGFGYVDGSAAVTYDPPGTASVYVSKEYPILDRGVIMRWITVPQRLP